VEVGRGADSLTLLESALSRKQEQDTIGVLVEQGSQSPRGLELSATAKAERRLMLR